MKNELHKACMKGDLEEVISLLQEDETDQMEYVDDDDSIDDSISDALPLHYASYYGHDDCVRALLNHASEKGELDQVCRARDYHDLTPFMEAVVNGHVNVIMVFIEFSQVNADLEWDLTHPDFLADGIRKGDNLLAIAIIKGLNELSRYLISEGSLVNDVMENVQYLDHDEFAQPDTKTVFPINGTALHVACAECDGEIIRALLDAASPDTCSERDGHNRSAIYFLLLNDCEANLLASFLEHDKCPEISGYDGRDLLQISYNRNNLECLDLLLAKGKVGVDEPDRNGLRVIDYAVKDNNDAALKIINKHNPQYHAVLRNTGRKRAISEMVAEIGPDLAGGILEPEMALDIAHEVASQIIQDTEGDSALYSDDSDEGNTVIHSAVKKGRGKVLKEILNDNSVDQRLRNNKNETVIHVAKKARTLSADYDDGNQSDEEYSSDAYDELRDAQARHFGDETTGSSSSEHSSENEQQKISSEIDTLDLSYLSGKTCVVHYRGVNFHREYFHHTSRSFSKTKHAGVSLNSKLAFSNADLQFDGEILTKTQQVQLNAFDKKLVEYWRGHLDIKKEVKPWWNKKVQKKGKIFKRPSHAIQHRYTNRATIEEEGVHGDVFDDIWKNLKDIGMLPHQPGLELNGSPLISTGKTPHHALSYALGSSKSKLNQLMRADPRYRPDGRPKYKYIGMLYIILHTLEDYHSACKVDVTREHFLGNISIRPNLFNETEVAFVGGVDGKHVVASIPITFPNFSIDYDPAYHFENYGITQLQYVVYRYQFSRAQRPFDWKMEHFDGEYNPRYESAFGISEDIFNEYKRLLSIDIKSLSQEDLKQAKITSSDDAIRAIIDVLSRERYFKQYVKSGSDGAPTYNKILEKIKVGVQLNKNEIAAIRKDFAFNDFCLFTHGKKGQINAIFKCGIENRQERLHQIISSNIRDLSVYRQLKNQLRKHFSGVAIDGSKITKDKNNQESFLCHKIEMFVRGLAKKFNFELVYITPDGKSHSLNKDYASAKADITNMTSRPKPVVGGHADAAAEVGIFRQSSQSRGPVKGVNSELRKGI